MLLQCFNISSNFQPMRSTFLPCRTKTFQHVRSEPELLLWLPEFRPSSRIANSQKRSFSLSRTLLPLSSEEAPAGYPYKNSNNRNEKKEKARGGRQNGCALSFSFLTSLSTTQRGFCGGESPAAEGDLRKRPKFMQARTPVVQKLTNPTLRRILYPMDSVPG